MVKDETPITRNHPEGCVCEARVNPGSSRSRVEGLSAGRIVISVHAQPQQGKANREALRVLSDFLGVPPSRLAILKGGTSRNKSVLVRGLSEPEIRDLLASLSR